MTATQSSPTTGSSSAQAAGGLPEASLPEAVAILVTGVVPALVRGLFRPRIAPVRISAPSAVVTRETAAGDHWPGPTSSLPPHEDSMLRKSLSAITALLVVAGLASAADAPVSGKIVKVDASGLKV